MNAIREREVRINMPLGLAAAMRLLCSQRLEEVERYKRANPDLDFADYVEQLTQSHAIFDRAIKR